MGKKNKKSDKTQNKELPSTNAVKVVEPEDLKVNLETHSKKKNRKRDLNGTLVEDVHVQKKTEINESDALEQDTIVKTKKNKKKRHTKLTLEQPCAEVQIDTDELNENPLNIPKKKKEKGKLFDEDDKHVSETSAPLEDHKPQKNREKKNKASSLHEPNMEKVKTTEKQNNETVQKIKKKKTKAKTGAPVLNNEEAQVTEEDIDRFVDELDEEDNKQYEDWVKLLDVRLSKKERTA